MESMEAKGTFFLSYYEVDNKNLLKKLSDYYENSWGQTLSVPEDCLE